MGKPVSDMRYSKYILPNGREVYLTQRPDSSTPESVAQFLVETKPIVRFQFTDNMIRYPFVGRMDMKEAALLPPAHWYPWVPGKNIPIESVFAFICLMDTYVNQGTTGGIWLHCDSSTMRAPTFFGLYLYALYDAETVLDICEKMTVSDNFDLKYAQYSRADRYAKTSIRKDPGVRELVFSWRSGGVQKAYEQYMKVPEKFGD